MKVKFIIALILGISAFAFLYKDSYKETINGFKESINPAKTAEQTGGFNDSFYVSALTCGTDVNYLQYAPLGFNLWTCYRSKNDSSGWVKYAPHDTLLADAGSYQTDVKNLIDSNYNRHGMKTLLDRTKITYLGYGARSDYHCVYDISDQYPDYWFYTYNLQPDRIHTIDTVDNSIYGNGEKVRFCKKTSSNGQDAGYVVKNLLCNREQLEMGSPSFIDDSVHQWIVKPRIRIDSNFAHLNRTTPVCRIEIVNRKGDTIKTVTLIGRNFLNDDGYYNGKYLEQYYNLPADYLTISNGRAMNPDCVAATDTAGCRADYRVYWFDNCDMWIDYIRVDNEVANRLLKPGGDQEFDLWLEWEANIANNSQGALQFYVEEWEFNNLPCMKYISHKLDSLTNGKYNLMACLNFKRMFYHIPPNKNKYIEDAFEQEAITYIKKMFINATYQRQIFTGSYTFEGDYGGSLIPNTLPKGTVSYNPDEGILASSTTPEDYERWLQSHFDSDHGCERYIKTMKRAKEISMLTETNIPFVNLVQTHLQYSPGEGAEKRREPTNSEISLMVNLGLSYSAKSNIYFWYWNWGTQSVNSNYDRGLTEPTTNAELINGSIPYNQGFQKRLLNAYGEAKWDSIVSLNARLRKLGPYFIQFDVNKSSSYRYHDYFTYYEGMKHDERDNLKNNTYIKELKTYHSVPNNINPDDDSVRYLQVSTYDKAQSGFEKYFYVVNRRCSPGTGPTGGQRKITISFGGDNNKLDYFNNWKVLNLLDNSEIGTIDKQILSEIDLGLFQPGEGRLYKLIPVMVDGGELAGDENVTGISFECHGAVYGNGKNITIGSGTNITFTNDGELFLVNANLDINSSGNRTTGRVTITANGGSWRGINVTNGNLTMINTDITAGNTSTPDNSSDYSVYCNNCVNTNIIGCNFTLTGLSKAISLMPVKQHYDETSNTVNAVTIYNDNIMNNVIVSAASDLPVINLISTGTSDHTLMFSERKPRKAPSECLPLACKSYWCYRSHK